jgi:hypothetical protein
MSIHNKGQSKKTPVLSLQLVTDMNQAGGALFPPGNAVRLARIKVKEIIGQRRLAL